jgi:hypothetical protein
MFCYTEEWTAIAERQMPCRHRKVAGTLIRDGFLYGLDEAGPQRKTLRAADLLQQPRCTSQLRADFQRPVRRQNPTAPVSGSNFSFFCQVSALAA